MRKIFAVIAMVLAIAQAPMPVAGQTSDKSAHDSKDKGQPANAGANPSHPTLPVTAQNPNDHQLTATNVSNSAPKTEWGWHEKIAWISNLILTGFLIWGVIVARVTLKGINRQTKAIEATVSQQEVAFYQWVEFVGWKTTINQPETKLNISFRIVNKSKFPLTLKVAEIGFFDGKQKSFIPTRFVLPGSPERFDGAHIDIGEARAITFATRRGLVLAIAISLSFISVREEEITQSFGGLLHCGDKARFEQTGPATRKVRPSKQDGSHRPN
jgi:hypothetical protein